jgi:hypothetical protein
LDLESTRDTVLEQNTSDYGPVIFVRRVDVPARAERIRSLIHITADNAYDLLVNGVPVGSGNDWNVISQFPVTLHPGANWLVVRATNFAGPPQPFENPAALLYKLRVTYHT